MKHAENIEQPHTLSPEDVGKIVRMERGGSTYNTKVMMSIAGPRGSCYIFGPPEYPELPKYAYRFYSFDEQAKAIKLFMEQQQEVQ